MDKHFKIFVYKPPHKSYFLKNKFLRQAWEQINVFSALTSCKKNYFEKSCNPRKITQKTIFQHKLLHHLIVYNNKRKLFIFWMLSSSSKKQATKQNKLLPIFIIFENIINKMKKKIK